MPKRLITIIALMSLTLALISCATSPEPVNGVLLPYPEEGTQYRMSEICQHLQARSYDVRGTIHHQVDADDLSGLLELIPSLVRQPVENYIGDGIGIEIEIRSLCNALNE